MVKFECSQVRPLKNAVNGYFFAPTNITRPTILTKS